MTIRYRYRKQIRIGIIIFLLLSGVTVGIIYYLSNQEKEEEPVKEEVKLEKKEETTELLQVDIKGEVNNPGTYSLKENSRVIDVIEKAGGITENADLTVINLSKKITDEMVIIIYTREEVENFKQTKDIEKLVEEKCIQKEENALINNACITTEETISGKISINTSTLEELMTLPGIGESKAKDIITYREKNGPFQSIEDLLNISGIGENILAQIQEDITV